MYISNVNDKFKFENSAEDLAGLDIVEIKKGKFHVLLENRSYTAEVLETDYVAKTFTILVNGKSFNVRVEDDYDILIQKLGLKNQTAKKVNKIKAPMPGLVIDVLVKEGDIISKGQSLLILEAMKMENVLKAPSDGVIKHLLVDTGSSVDKNQDLLELE